MAVDAVAKQQEAGMRGYRRMIRIDDPVLSKVLFEERSICGYLFAG